MPSPAQLGIAPTRSLDLGTVDWGFARRKLDQLGAVCFNLEKRSEGGYRFSCHFSTTEAGRTHRVEATAATEAEVLGLVVAKADEWAASH